jgi:hypothetical protein
MAGAAEPSGGKAVIALLDNLSRDGDVARRDVLFEEVHPSHILQL